MKNRFPCLVCGVDTLNDVDCFSVHNEIWLEAVPEWNGHLCLKCLRKRLGRDLKLSDFMLEYETNEHITQRFLNKVNNA